VGELDSIARGALGRLVESRFNKERKLKSPADAGNVAGLNCFRRGPMDKHTTNQGAAQSDILACFAPRGEVAA
jgi:hypothetical protein